MKELDEIQEEVKVILKDWNWPEDNINQLFNNPAVLTLVEEVAHRFAKEACREALRNASENVNVKIAGMGFIIVDKQSILNESNIPTL